MIKTIDKTDITTNPFVVSKKFRATDSGTSYLLCEPHKLWVGAGGYTLIGTEFDSLTGTDVLYDIPNNIVYLNHPEDAVGSLICNHKNLDGILDVSACKNLQTLDCSFNLLSNVYMTSCPSLVNVDCRDNLLITLLSPASTVLTTFSFYNKITFPMNSVDIDMCINSIITTQLNGVLDYPSGNTSISQDKLTQLQNNGWTTQSH